MAGPAGSLGNYNYDRSAPRDRRWALAYLALWALCAAAGLYVAAYGKPSQYTEAEIAKLPASACPREWLSSEPSHPRRSLLAAPEHKHSPMAVAVTIACTLASLAGSLLLGAAFLRVLRQHAELAVHATIVLQVALPLAGGAACLLSLLAGARPDDVVPAAISLLVFGFTCLAICWTARKQVPAAVRLLRMSADCMAANPALTRVAVALCVAALAAVAPLLWFFDGTMRSGSLVANPSRLGSPACRDSDGKPVPCCEFMPDGWVVAYAIIPLPFLILWTLTAAAQARKFVISGAVTQWYFAPAGAEGATKGTTLRSLRHAFGPQIGTLCYAGAVTVVAQYVTALADSLRRRGGLLGCLLAHPLHWAAAAVQELTKFAVIVSAITGESLRDSGRRSLDLLRRNALEAFTSAYWLAPWTVCLTALLFSAGWGALAAAATGLLKAALELGGSHTQLTWNALWAFGGLSAGSCLVVCCFLGSVLLEVLDACFVCWALDRDSSAVSKPEVHSAFEAVPVQPLQPATGVAVQQPGGGLAYGAAPARAAAAGARAAAPLAASGPARDEEAAQQLRPLLSGAGELSPALELSAA